MQLSQNQVLYAGKVGNLIYHERNSIYYIFYREKRVHADSKIQTRPHSQENFEKSNGSSHSTSVYSVVMVTFICSNT
jgi:hypothetical protein